MDEHAHLVAVLLTEQHHRAGLLRIVHRHHARLGARVGEDLGVDEGLHRADLLLGHRRVVREVEARALLVDQRALLLHVRAQRSRKRLVHQVRRAVVAHGARTALGVDARDEQVARA